MKKILKKLTDSKKKKIILSILLIIVVIFVLRVANSGDEVDIKEKAPRSVDVSTVYNIANNTTPLPLVGRVETQSEAIIRTESQGEISYVNKKLGDSVFAGEIIAEIKNTSQRAEVLRAQGVLQSAEANLLKVNSGSGEAKNIIINSINNAFITADDAVKNKVDQFITNPNSSSPEVVVASQSYFTREAVEDARVEIGKVLSDWSLSVSTLSSVNDSVSLNEKYREAEENMRKVQAFMDTVAIDVNTFEERLGTTQADVNKWKSDVSVARSSVNSSLSSLISSFNTFSSQIGIGDKGEDILSAEAQVTQAEAGLISAQASLEKTIVRSPITGALNSLNIKRGDFVSAFQDVAEVVGGGELEVVAFISENDRESITEGSTVTIEGNNAGVVSRIAPGINSQNQKIEIRISVVGENNLKNGQSVSMKIDRQVDEEREINTISIPLSALKITSINSYVFQVNENNTIVEKEVIPGSVVGDKIIILEGLTLDDSIILDLRGLKVGQEITVN
jgi:RND family efflux transporter MFP subunit